MLNFKKGSIFSRSEGNEDAYEEYEQEDQGGVLAVWGSPGSGKTTVAARIAKHLAGKHKNTILLLCDMSAPMLPCICPPRDLENKGSLGSVLAAAHVSDSLIRTNLTTHRRLGRDLVVGAGWAGCCLILSAVSPALSSRVKASISRHSSALCAELVTCAMTATP